MKVALIGDLHFGKLAATNELAVPGEPLEDIMHNAAPLLQGFTEIIKAEGVEFLVVAGDLTSTGSPVEYTRCFDQLRSSASSGGVAEENIIICTGNHDVDWRISKIADNYIKKPQNGFPAADIKRLYQAVAASQGEACTGYSLFSEKGPAPFSGCVHKDDVIFFVLNSGWKCTHDSANPHGKLDAIQLQWFESVAGAYSAETKWKMLLLHHHPFNYPYPLPGHDVSLLEEGPELLELAGKNGIHLVCHGHRHHPKAYNKHSTGWKEPITFICAGSFSVNANHRNCGTIPNTFHIVHLQKQDMDRVVSLHSYQYAPSDGWSPLRNNCPETPLDPIMVFSRPYDLEEQCKSIETIINTASNPDQIKMPAWHDLPLDLKAMSFRDLNAAVRKKADEEYEMIGTYPDGIVLLRRGL